MPASEPLTPLSETENSARPWHVRDVARRNTEVQRCSCGFMSRTVEEMRQHVAAENQALERSSSTAGARVRVNMAGQRVREDVQS